MNKLEKSVYNIVKSNPRIKNLIRNTYQRIFDLFGSQQSRFFRTHKFLENGFHGFHDCTPVNGDKISYLVPPTHLRMPIYGDRFELRVAKIDDLGLIYSSKTSAMNFHKGSRQQWLADDEIILNDFDTAGNLISRIINIRSSDETVLKFPIDSVAVDSRLFSSFDYQRLEFAMPGYGYPFPHNSQLNLCPPSLLIFNERSEVVRSFQFNHLNEYLNPYPQDWFHFFTHTIFSPDESRLASLFRSVDPKDVSKRITQLIIFEVEGGNILVLPTTGMASHYAWLNSNEILGYFSVEGKDGHYIYNVRARAFRPFFPDILKSDGHHSVSSCGRFALVDTYPDKWRLQKLFLFDLEKMTSELICEVFHPKIYQSPDIFRHWSCDLHPRFHEDGFSIDLINNGQRAIAIFDLPEARHG